MVEVCGLGLEVNPHLLPMLHQLTDLQNTYMVTVLLFISESVVLFCFSMTDLQVLGWGLTNSPPDHSS